MSFKYGAALLAVAMLSMGCEDGGSTPIGDDTAEETGNTPTPTPMGPPLIQVVEAECAGSGLRIGFENENWGYAPIVYIFDTQNDTAAAVSVWSEEHPLDQSNLVSNDATSDVWSVTLSSVSSPSQVDPGSSTLFGCDFFNENALTYAVEVFNSDENGGGLADCAVWGHDPNAIVNGTWPDGADPINGEIGNSFSNCIAFQ